MFKVIDINNILESLNKNPVMCYCSMPGACGPSGLCVAFFDDGSSYGYNTRFDNNQDLLRKIVEYIPELGACGIGSAIEDSDSIKKRRLSHIGKMKCINLGLGNYVYLKQPLFIQLKKYAEQTKEMMFTVFRKYIETMGYDDLFTMWELVENELNKDAV